MMMSMVMRTTRALVNRLRWRSMPRWFGNRNFSFGWHAAVGVSPLNERRSTFQNLHSGGYP